MIKTFNLKEFLFFGLAGVVGYLVDAGSTLLLAGTLGPYLARIPAFIGAASVTWLINRSTTFKHSDKRHDNLVKEYFHYLSIMIVGLIANYIVYAIAVKIIGQTTFAILLSVALGSLAGMVVNYFNSKKYIFTKKI